MSMQDKVQELLLCIETEATRLRSDEGKDDLPDSAEVAATVAYSLAMVIALAQSVEILHAERNRLNGLLEGLIARVDGLVQRVGEISDLTGTGLSALNERVLVLEENSFNDDLRSEIVDEATRRAKDELDWELSDKADGYELRELESRIGDLESNVSTLECQVENLGESSDA